MQQTCDGAFFWFIFVVSSQSPDPLCLPPSCVAAAPPSSQLRPTKMVVLSLKICVRQCNVVKTMQFEPSTAVYDACRIIRERVPEAQTGQGECALTLSAFLEFGSRIEFYIHVSWPV